MEVQLVHGLPYNPQGQGIIERAHRTLKEYLLKQKGRCNRPGEREEKFHRYLDLEKSLNLITLSNLMGFSLYS